MENKSNIYLIDFMILGFFSETIVFIVFFDFSEAVRILYKHVRSYQLNQILLLCDHQELACTPKDPPRRIDMKELSLISFCNAIYWVIDRTV